MLLPQMIYLVNKQKKYIIEWKHWNSIRLIITYRMLEKILNKVKKNVIFGAKASV